MSKKNLIVPLLNLGLKGMTILSRFFLVLYISKFFDIEELGEYGLFNTSVMFLLILLGFDFYQYANREIVHAGKEGKFLIITQQSLFFLLSYVVFLPLVLLVFFSGVLPFNLMLIFYGVLILEHLNQEFFRLFIALSQPVMSGVITFLKSGLWTLVVLGVWIMTGNSVWFDLSYVYLLWFGGNVLAFLLGTGVILRTYKGVKLGKIDFGWISKGVKVSLFFFIGTIAYKVIELSDRYMIEFFLTKKEVGVYTFFFQISNIVHVVIFTAVLMMFYPKILKAAGEKSDLVFVKNKMSVQVYLISILTAVLLYIGTPYLLGILNKVEFRDNFSILLLLMIGNLCLNFSFIYHFVLIALKKDVLVMYITVIGAVVNVSLNLFLIPEYGISGAAYSSIAGFGIMFLLKTFFGKKLINQM